MARRAVGAALVRGRHGRGVQAVPPRERPPAPARPPGRAGATCRRRNCRTGLQHSRRERGLMLTGPPPEFHGTRDILEHGALWLKALADGHKPELIEPAEHGQVRAREARPRGSVRHVEVFRMGSVRTSIFGRPRPLPGPRRAEHQARIDVTPRTPSTVKSLISLLETTAVLRHVTGSPGL